MSFASSIFVPSFEVMTSFVISSLTNFVESEDSNNTSRSVRIPISLDSESTTSKPETSFSVIISSALPIVSSWCTRYGFSITTLPERFTFRTWFTCSFIVKKRWIIPMPPCRAIVTAILDSVTVSMLALIRGMFNVMFLDNLVDRSVCERLEISENLGTRRTSSNVNPSLMLKRTSYQKEKFCYKPFLLFLTNFL